MYSKKIKRVSVSIASGKVLYIDIETLPLGFLWLVGFASRLSVCVLTEINFDNFVSYSGRRDFRLSVDFVSASVQLCYTLLVIGPYLPFLPKKH